MLDLYGLFSTGYKFVALNIISLIPLHPSLVTAIYSLPSRPQSQHISLFKIPHLSDTKLSDFSH